MKYRMILFFLITFLFTGCELTKEIDYESVGYARRIVIEGRLNSETGVSAVIKRTVPPNKLDESSYLESPEVWLYQNGVAYAQLYETDSSQYVLNDTVTLYKNCKYKLVVSALGYETATSNAVQILTPPIINSVYQVRDTSSNWITFIYVKFLDQMPTIDTYNVQIVPYYNGNTKAGSTIWGEVTDEGFSTSEKTFVGSYRRGILDSAEVQVTVESNIVTQYYQSYSDYETSYGDYFYDRIYMVKSFVDNGFGYFGSFETARITFVLNE